MKTQLTYVMAALAMCALTVAVPLAPGNCSTNETCVSQSNPNVHSEGNMAVRQAEDIDVIANGYNKYTLLENDQAMDAEAADADVVGPKGNGYNSYTANDVD